MKIEKEFKVEKETKNTYKFEEIKEVKEPPVIGTLYVQKWVFERPPSRLRITIEVDEQ